VVSASNLASAKAGPTSKGGLAVAENIVFSTADQRPAEQFPYWREVVCASITRLGVERRGSGPFLAEMQASSLGGLHIVTARADAHQRRRSREDIARESDDPFFLYLPLSGSLRLEYADGQQLVAAPGTPCFLDPLRVARADAEAGALQPPFQGRLRDDAPRLAAGLPQLTAGQAAGRGQFPIDSRGADPRH
jgi:hypothetical protein